MLQVSHSMLLASRMILCGHCSPRFLEAIAKVKLISNWYLARTRGSHRQFKHITKLCLVPGKASDDLAAETLNSILKQAGLK